MFNQQSSSVLDLANSLLTLRVFLAKSSNRTFTSLLFTVVFILYILGARHKFPYAHLANQMNRAFNGDLYKIVYLNIIEL